ncbi:MAG: chemotaxis protein CheV [Succinivibrio sp.]|nr:chemotaxis protein CheV [Succinivibrio sp.]
MGVLDSISELSTFSEQNRMELLLFKLSGLEQCYGLNVFKVKEVLACPPLTVMPKLQRYVMGVVHVRGQTLSVIDLAMAIGGRPSTNPESSFIIISEYNRSKQAFLCSKVVRILTLSWSKIMPPPKGAGRSHYITAVTEIGGELVEILDVEKVINEISPVQTQMKEVNVATHQDFIEKAKQRKIVILVADDSLIARKQVKSSMTQIGVEIIEVKDGKQALQKLEELSEKGDIYEQIKLVISDVEMPEMDGYTLCASIKQNPKFKNLYVILHSSLSGVFNKSMIDKVGADDFITKFSADDLAHAVRVAVEKIDGKEGAA